MKNRLWIAILAVMMCAGLESSCSSSGGKTPSGPSRGGATVVFLGASITEGFSYPGEGQFFPGYDFRKVTVYEEDKSGGFAEVRGHSPAAVVIKECGAYFDSGGGTDLGYLQSRMVQAIDFARSIGAIPVPATVLPVDVGYGGCTGAQLDDIRSFNRWLRDYASARGYTVMDYCARIADESGELPRPYHDGDGLHPNQAGYSALGPIVVPTLERAGISF